MEAMIDALLTEKVDEIFLAMQERFGIMEMWSRLMTLS